MKKNNMLRLASVLLVAVLLSTCAISGVFAQYQIQASDVKDDARVAKWGVYIDASGEMFANAYKNAKVDYNTDESADKTLVTVKGATADDFIVAPGTNGSLAAISVTGTPEVDVNVTYEATLTLTGWELEDDTFYCPIVITITGEGAASEVFNGLDYTSATDLQNDVAAAIVDKEAYYDANTDLSCVNNDFTVTWAWAYKDATGSKINQSIANDTYLGNQAAADNAAEIELSITTTITQAD